MRCKENDNEPKLGSNGSNSTAAAEDCCKDHTDPIPSRPGKSYPVIWPIVLRGCISIGYVSDVSYSILLLLRTLCVTNGHATASSCTDSCGSGLDTNSIMVYFAPQWLELNRRVRLRPWLARYVCFDAVLLRAWCLIDVQLAPLQMNATYASSACC